jgi:hypothetical protein
VGNIGYEVNVSGTSNTTAGQSLWVIVQNVKNLRYYPQNTVTPDQNGKWLSKVNLGDPNAGIGESFNIIAVLANQSAHSAFLSYKTTEVQQNYPGMDKLPDGITNQTTVTVKRTE